MTRRPTARRRHRLSWRAVFQASILLTAVCLAGVIWTAHRIHLLLAETPIVDMTL